MEETQLRFRTHLECSPQGQAILRWDMLNSSFDEAPFRGTIPPWERPPLGLIRRRPLRRSNPAARERLVQRIRQDKAIDEMDVFTDAAVSNNAAAVAWACPEFPPLDGSRNISQVYGLVEEAELFGILGALQSIQENRPSLPQTKLRIITDSHVALRELNRPFSPNATATTILRKIQELRQESVHIRLVWTPAHTEGITGNQLAHMAARECLSHPPMVSSDSPPRDSPHLPWPQNYRKEKILSRQRLQESSPEGFLTSLKPLPRKGEVIANKIYANAAYTPDILFKWTYPRATYTPKCTFCQELVVSNLYHLIWICPAFAQGRSQLLTLHCIPPDEQDHIRLIRADPSLLEAIVEFSIQNGLYKAV